MARVLVIRLSSFGDVAMLVPVITSVAEKYPQDRFTVLTRSAFAPLFSDLAFNINVLAFDPSGKHKGVFGLLRLTQKLCASSFTHVADEHNVLRTKFIRRFMAITGSRVKKIDKGRKEKEAIIKSKAIDHPLKSTLERYREVFSKLGFPANITFTNMLKFTHSNMEDVEREVGVKEGYWIGIAPFAKHEGKIYPIKRMENIVAQLSKDGKSTIFLFGAGKEEGRILNDWQQKYPRVHDMSGKLKLKKELNLIYHLDLMISMDSANMHLASLVNTPVVSIWGATHPALGFYGFNQSLDNAVQIDLECRPCSVYGNLPCARGDYACLTHISEQMVLDKIHHALNSKKS